MGEGEGRDTWSKGMVIGDRMQLVEKLRRSRERGQSNAQYNGVVVCRYCEGVQLVECCMFRVLITGSSNIRRKKTIEVDRL